MSKLPAQPGLLQEAKVRVLEHPELFHHLKADPRELLYNLLNLITKP